MPWMSTLLLFLAGVVLVSLSGVMMPGPVLAGAVAKGCEDKNAGIWIAVGHGLIEIPLILLIYLGLSYIFEVTPVRILIGVIGGSLMIYIGIGMFRIDMNLEAGAIHHSATFIGFVTSASNPAFYLWWVAIGSLLILTSLEYGRLGFILFVITHWLVDLGWYWIVTVSVFKSSQMFGEKIWKPLFILCGSTLVLFGVWFVWDGVRGVLSLLKTS
ncbi:MAG: lysine transporter LysE [Candidatus Syntrophoarchaeum sp. WYZ-LMO15]|nr:MAG: lysine transporter LysE [Candidatus Syntrophoarchaeum sp. WYZ-LMO15]